MWVRRARGGKREAWKLGQARPHQDRAAVSVRADDRPSGSDEPPAAFYRYSPDRKGERSREHLEAFTGVMQADAYAGFGGLYRKNRIVDARRRVMRNSCLPESLNGECCPPRMSG